MDKTGISKDDLVLEAGAGSGIITNQLIRVAKRVIAFETDKNLFEKLRLRFKDQGSLELKQEDFLTVDLPAQQYKFFSNIPFSITSAIIKKLTLGTSSPEDAYLIVQKEAAAKFAGKPFDFTNSQMAVILHSRFEFRLAHEFNATDFFPRPNVEIVLLEIKKRLKSLVSDEDKYRDFVTSSFNQPKRSILPKNSRPGELDFEDWISFFKQFQTQPETKRKMVRGAYEKQMKEQEKIEKIHRTRIDKNWRNF